jgi:hypothetical protein
VIPFAIVQRARELSATTPTKKIAGILFQETGVYVTIRAVEQWVEGIYRVRK